MVELKQFHFGNSEIRVIDREGESWFVAKDIATILDYRNTNDATRILDDDEKGTHKVRTLGGEQEVSMINESGLYSLVLRSNKPEAKVFKKWVTSEVLPTIRKHGGYLTPEKTREIISNPDSFIQMLEILKEKDEAKRLAEEESQKNLVIVQRQQRLLDIQKPKVEFVEQVFDDGSLVDIGQAAKILNLGFGRNTLFEKLREKGVLFKTRNEPMQRYIDQNLFVLKEKEIQRSEGPQIVTKVLVTQKGLYFIKNLFESQVKLGFTSHNNLIK